MFVYFTLDTKVEKARPLIFLQSWGMKEKNLNILKAGLGVEIHFELKGNLTDSTVWNTGETGDIHLYTFTIKKFIPLRQTKNQQLSNCLKMLKTWCTNLFLFFEFQWFIVQLVKYIQIFIKMSYGILFFVINVINKSLHLIL